MTKKIYLHLISEYLQEKKSIKEIETFLKSKGIIVSYRTLLNVLNYYTEKGRLIRHSNEISRFYYSYQIKKQ